MSNDIQVTLYKLVGYAAQLFGIISIGMIAFTVVSVLKSVKKEFPLTKKRLITSALFSVISVSIFVYFSPISTQTKQWVIFGGIGLAIGYIWSRTIEVYKKDKKVFNKNTPYYVIVWAVTFGISQLFMNLQNKFSNASLMASILSAGIVIGMNTSLFQRFFAAKEVEQKANQDA